MDAADAGMATGDDPPVVIAAFLVTVSSVILVAAAALRWSRRTGGGAPSPASSLPLLGHLHLIGKPPLHRSLAALAGGGGAPLMSLQLGARRAVLVSSHAAAEACFAAPNDASLAGRPALLAAEVLGYGRTLLGWAPHGDHWRRVRRFLAAEVFSAPRLAARSAGRRAEVAAIVGNLLNDVAGAHSGGGTVTRLRPRLFELVLNVMLRALTGEPGGAGDARRFQEIVKEGFAVSGAPCLGDFFSGAAVARPPPRRRRGHGPPPVAARRVRRRPRRRPATAKERQRRRARRGEEGEGRHRRRAPGAARDRPGALHRHRHQRHRLGTAHRRDGHVGADDGVGDGGAADAPGIHAKGASRARRRRRHDKASRRAGHRQPPLPAVRGEGDPTSPARRPRDPGARGHGGLHCQWRRRRAARHDGARQRVGDPPGPKALGRAGGLQAGAVHGRRRRRRRSGADAAVRARPEAVPRRGPGDAACHPDGGGAGAVLRVGGGWRRRRRHGRRRGADDAHGHALGGCLPAPGVCRARAVCSDVTSNLDRGC